MLRTVKQRLRRIELMAARLAETRDEVRVRDQKIMAVDDAWLARDEEGNRVGPNDACNDSTRRVYEALILMEEATCRTITEEV